VTGWGWSGIDLGGTDATKSTETSLIENVQASRNLRDGIRSGSTMTIRSCTAAHNGGYGIYATRRSTITASTAVANQTGIYVYGGSARGCTASENVVQGILAVSASVVDCTAQNGLGVGIFAQEGSVVEDCSVVDNDGAGIMAASTVRVANCAVKNNLGVGIFGLGSHVTVVGNIVSGAGMQATAIPCIRLQGTHSVITDNNAYYSNIGIEVISGSSGANRIEKNHLSGNELGLKVDGSANLVFGNTARNTVKNYQIAASNRVGTIVVPPLSGPISGNTGGASGAADPWSNFAF
jgi:parallel beta-helix repeat protein